MRLWLAGAFAAVSLITAFAVYFVGDNRRALGVAVVIGILAGFLIAAAISRRVSRLAQAAGEMASGSFDAPLKVSGPDEIGDLARALESMRASLKESFGVLTADRNKLEAIFDGLTDAVMVVDDGGPVRFSNSAAVELLDRGRPPEAMLPQLRRATEFGFAAHPALRIGDRAYSMQARALPDERAVLAVVRDRTEEMRREFAEADFVSNAAHELRNPLAGISGAIEVLRSGAKDDPRARDHFLSRLAEDAERMNRLTQALLTLARVESVGTGGGRGGRRADCDPRRRRCGRGAQARRPRRRGRAGPRRQGRPDPAAPGDDRPAHQRLQEHATPRRRYRTRPPRRRDGSDLGSHRHRNRHPGSGDRARLRALLPPQRDAQAGGLRPRPGDRPPHGRRDGRPDRRQLCRGSRQYLLGTSSHGPTQPDTGGLTMSSGRILVADDEPSVRESVGYALAQDGFDVDVAADGDEATEKVGDGIPYDLLILDIMMPGPSGLDICREVRSRSPVPIIVLTAKDAEVDKVVGLEVGADDYVTKPFSVRELLGRVRAQLRRRELDRGPLNQAVKIEAGAVAIDLVRHVAMVREVPINLTRSEFQLLRLLVSRPGEVFPRRQIMEELWQTEFDGDERACDVHISNLRQKVERDPQLPELVLTVRGVGYKFDGQSA